MRHLCDSNVFVALTLGQHAGHDVSRAWLHSLVKGDTLVFCRMTQMSFVRLLTQQVAPGYRPVSNAAAVEHARRWRALPFVELAREPEGVETTWLRLADAGQASPKRWMDAYLAAFAIRSGLRCVTFDKGFQEFVPHGLDLHCLATPS